MRLKQLLGLLVLLLVTSAMAYAAGPQLTNVSVAAQGNATVVSIHASGAFTHTEYRPTETLLLIDLNGVSAGKWKEQTRALDVPGVTAYHVLGYTGASGSEVARVEMTIAAGTTVDVSEAGSGNLAIKIGGKAVASKAAAPAVKPATLKESAATPAVKPVATKVAEKAVAQAPLRQSGAPVTVSNIAVVRGNGTLDVEISGNGPMSPKAMKLSSPARVVVDIANAVPAVHNKTVSVNSADVKEIRMGRFQSAPPVTRIVVDLAEAHDFDLVPSGNKVVLKLHTTEAHASTPAPVRTPVATPAVSAQKTTPKQEERPAVSMAAMTSPSPMSSVPEPAPMVAKAEPPAQPAPAPSQEYVVVEPKYREQQPDAAPISDAKATAESAAKVVETAMKPQDSMLPPVSASMQAQPAMNMAQQQQAQMSAPSTPARPKYTGEPISVNLKDVDLKDFFRLIHEISGLNIVLDPNVRGSLTLVLDDVPWDQALDIVLQNNGLERKLDGNVLRIATTGTLKAEADAQRAKNEAEALSVPKVVITHFLSYAKAGDVMPTVKRFLTQRGDVIADQRTNSLIIQDIPSVIPEVQRLLGQLDRKTQEVEIEARVIAASRSFARDIGMQLGFGWGNGPSAVGGAPVVGTSPLMVTTAQHPYFTIGSSQIPLFSNTPAVNVNSGLSFNNVGSSYRIDAILTMAENRGLVKILSRPRVVTQNNVQALVRQGVSVPVVTAAQLGGPPTTTYVQAFLRLTVTPQITVENTIFLQIDVENTTPDFSRQVSGNPTLITQQATTSVLVNDGGTVVIGGVIQTQNSVTVDQVPLLGSIPVLGNLFRHRGVSTSTNELLFFVTPRIVQT